MPQYQIDAGGFVQPEDITKAYMGWRDLDAFTQGYIEALFFTENSPGWGREDTLRDNPDGGGGQQRRGDNDEWWDLEGSIPEDAGFSDLAPKALAAILRDCKAFQETNAAALEGAYEDASDVVEAWTKAGRDFWYTRNGHGVGFWDGDWPEPYGDELAEACKAFSELDVEWGDDGQVHILGE